jgi:hypothetical protein
LPGRWTLMFSQYGKYFHLSLFCSPQTFTSISCNILTDFLQVLLHWFFSTLKYSMPGSMAQVVESLPSKSKVLSSNPSTKKKKILACSCSSLQLCIQANFQSFLCQPWGTDSSKSKCTVSICGFCMKQGKCLQITHLVFAYLR